MIFNTIEWFFECLNVEISLYVNCQVVNAQWAIYILTSVVFILCRTTHIYVTKINLILQSLRNSYESI